MQYVINLFRANKIRVAYGIGDYAICLYWSGVSLYLLYFYPIDRNFHKKLIEDIENRKIQNVQN